jgi:uncharacterized BrkB/YihY/UPF0761 family membrane protein
MVAYNMLLGAVPVALLALFVGGQILSSHSVQQSVLRDLRGIFPGADAHTLDSLLEQIQSSTASTGVLALLASVARIVVLGSARHRVRPHLPLQVAPVA